MDHKLFSLGILLSCASLFASQANRVAGVSAQQLWAEAWSSTLRQFGLSQDAVDRMPAAFKARLQHKAEKRWKRALQEHKAAVSPTRDVSTTEFVEQVTTTTINRALQMLLSGIDGNPVVADPPSPLSSDIQSKAALSTTTTTTDTTAIASNNIMQRLLLGVDGDGPKKSQASDDAVTDVVKQSVKTDVPAKDVSNQQQQLLEIRGNVMGRLTQGLSKIDDDDATSSMTTTMASSITTTTTTVNVVMQKLLLGVDSDAPRQSSLADVSGNLKASGVMDAMSTTTTTVESTTTEDPKVAMEREQQKQHLLEVHNAMMIKLTDGMDKIEKEEATRITSTVIEATTSTTTTKNLALARLLSGVDGPVNEPKLKGVQAVGFTTTTTTTTTTTQTIGLAGKRTLAFITSGKFAMPHHAEAQTEAQEADDDDEEKHVSDDADEAAADFDMDNTS